jgi:hypothetical protein
MFHRPPISRTNETPTLHGTPPRPPHFQNKCEAPDPPRDPSPARAALRGPPRAALGPPPTLKERTREGASPTCDLVFPQADIRHVCLSIIIHTPQTGSRRTSPRAYSRDSAVCPVCQFSILYLVSLCMLTHSKSCAPHAMGLPPVRGPCAPRGRQGAVRERASHHNLRAWGHACCLSILIRHRPGLYAYRDARLPNPQRAHLTRRGDLWSGAHACRAGSELLWGGAPNMCCMCVKSSLCSGPGLV